MKGEAGLLKNWNITNYSASNTIFAARFAPIKAAGITLSY